MIDKLYFKYRKILFEHLDIITYKKHKPVCDVLTYVFKMCNI